MNSTQSMLLGLHAETSIHAGAGSSLGVVDLPIQREMPTGYPVIFGSSIKGALRAYYSTDESDRAIVTALFGPENPDGDNAHAGALLIGDARIVALPVRSLTTQFKWVTCPYLVSRLVRDAQRLGVDLGFPKLPVIQKNELLAMTDGIVFLEEYRFEGKEAAALIKPLSAALGKLSGVEGFAATLEGQLVVVHDDDFAHLAKSATPVVAHVALNSATKTARTGALWYEETLPPETLMYVPVVANASRSRNLQRSAAENASSFRDKLAKRPWLQVGGNETVGMGWCKLSMIGGEK